MGGASVCHMLKLLRNLRNFAKKGSRYIDELDSRKLVSIQLDNLYLKELFHVIDLYLEDLTLFTLKLATDFVETQL